EITTNGDCKASRSYAVIAFSPDELTDKRLNSLWWVECDSLKQLRLFERHDPMQACGSYALAR
ncbi:MAG TPA: hypothetical protein VNO32_59775, partial [Candidatus Acidoferrum sp.]|nr:hypothetical protein [Candidatus Acidoferrum sp.]